MTRKTTFLRGGLCSVSIIWDWHKVSPWNFTPEWQRLKLKVRKFCGLSPTFVEVTGEKFVGGLFAPSSSPKSSIGLKLQRQIPDILQGVSSPGDYYEEKEFQVV